MFECWAIIRRDWGLNYGLWYGSFYLASMPGQVKGSQKLYDRISSVWVLNVVILKEANSHLCPKYITNMANDNRTIVQSQFYNQNATEWWTRLDLVQNYHHLAQYNMLL